MSENPLNNPDTPPDWESIAAREDFKSLLRAKASFIVPSTIFFLAYYMALPLLVGYAPELMKKKIWNSINVAYAFALSQFFMAWILAAIYVRKAGQFDDAAHSILSKSGQSGTDGKR